MQLVLPEQLSQACVRGTEDMKPTTPEHTVNTVIRILRFICRSFPIVEDVDDCDEHVLMTVSSFRLG
jgi:hypothetical protein